MISNGFSTSKLNNIYLLFSPSSKSEPWHQVDFMSAQNLSGILTQGSPSSDKWVSTFTVATSNDGINFDPVHDQQGKPIVYMSNMDRNTIARNFFPKVSFLCSLICFYQRKNKTKLEKKKKTDRSPTCF